MFLLRLIGLIAVMTAGAYLATEHGLTDIHVVGKLAFGLVWSGVACLVMFYGLVPDPVLEEEERVEELSDDDIEFILEADALPSTSEALRAVQG